MADMYDSQGKRATNFINLLDNLTLEKLLSGDGDYWRGKREHALVTVDANDSLEHALEVMSSNSILSAPVREQDNEAFLGFITMNDVMENVLHVYSQADDRSDSDATQWSGWCTDVETLNVRALKFASTSVRDVLAKCKHGAVCEVSENGTVFQLLEDVFSHGHHRAIVIRDTASPVEARPLGIVSQTDILHLLVENVAHLGAYASRSIDALKLWNPSVISMSEDAEAIIAFDLLKYHRVGGVAIVDSAGKLTSNLSASDLRGFSSSQFTTLVHPVRDFLAHISPHKPHAAISATPDATLETVLLKMAMFQIHRLWIVDDSERPIGVVSLTDVMRHFASGIDPAALPYVPHDTALSVDIQNAPPKKAFWKDVLQQAQAAYKQHEQQHTAADEDLWFGEDDWYDADEDEVALQRVLNHPSRPMDSEGEEGIQWKELWEGLVYKLESFVDTHMRCW